jgi:hypothetical protein
MRDWQRRDKYHQERAQLRRLGELSEFLLEELNKWESRSFDDGDKESWLAGYRRALSDMVEKMGLYGFEESQSLMDAALGLRTVADSLACIREKGGKGGKGYLSQISRAGKTGREKGGKGFPQISRSHVG